MLLVVGLSLAAVVGYGVHAQNRKPGTFTVYGGGSDSCGKWTQGRPDGRFRPEDSTAVTLDSWVLGFVSGSGYAIGNLRRVDSDGLDAFIDNYCHANPLKDISDAAAALVAELQKP